MTSPPAAGVFESMKKYHIKFSFPLIQLNVATWKLHFILYVSTQKKKNKNSSHSHKVEVIYMVNMERVQTNTLSHTSVAVLPGSEKKKHQLTCPCGCSTPVAPLLQSLKNNQADCVSSCTLQHAEVERCCRGCREVRAENTQWREGAGLQ